MMHILSMNQLKKNESAVCGKVRVNYNTYLLCLTMQVTINARKTAVIKDKYIFNNLFHNYHLLPYFIFYCSILMLCKTQMATRHT